MSKTIAKDPGEPVSIDDARKIVARFLASKPLYSPLTVALEASSRDTVDLYPDSLRKHCSKCREATNWEREDAKIKRQLARKGLTAVDARESWEGVDLLLFKCIQCRAEEFKVWVLREMVNKSTPMTATLTNGGAARHALPPVATVFRFRKLGQWEPWSIAPDPELTTTLTTEDCELYQKALMSMSHSYGIGALAYLRRVVENEVDRLLEVIEEVAIQDEDGVTIERLEKARKGHNADERLRLAVDAVPASLRVGGLNPMKSLYGAFSSALHGKTDGECLAEAERLRTAFEYVFKAVRAQVKARAELARVLTEGST